MSYALEILPSAAKAVARLPVEARRRINEHIEQLANDPRVRGHKKLKGRSSAYRIRVGDYRIIYTIDDTRRVVEIGIVGDRKDIYRK